MSPFGVGIVGAGAVTQTIHLPTLARLGDAFEVRHICDVSPDVAAAVADRAGARWSTDVDDLLADETVDVVAVCGPHVLHPEHVIAAARAGKRGILCEKPLAMSAVDAVELVRVVAETGTALVVGAMHAYDPGWRAAAAAWDDLVSSSVAIRSSVVLPPNSRFEDMAGEATQRPPADRTPVLGPDDQAAAVHAAVMGLAVHDLPLVRTFLPSTLELHVVDARFLHPFGYQIVLETGGKRVELHALMSETWQPDWVVEVAAPDQWLRTRFTPSYVHAGSAVSELHRAGTTTVLGPYASNGYEVEWRELADVLRGDLPTPDLEPLVHDLRLALTVAEAAADHIRSAHPTGVAA